MTSLFCLSGPILHCIVVISIRRVVGAHYVLFGTFLLFLFASICVISSIQCDHLALERCAASFLFLFFIVGSHSPTKSNAKQTACNKLARVFTPQLIDNYLSKQTYQ